MFIKQWCRSLCVGVADAIPNLCGWSLGELEYIGTNVQIIAIWILNIKLFQNYSYNSINFTFIAVILIFYF